MHVDGFNIASKFHSALLCFVIVFWKLLSVLVDSEFPHKSNVIFHSNFWCILEKCRNGRREMKGLVFVPSPWRRKQTGLDVLVILSA